MQQIRQEAFGHTSTGLPVTRYWLCSEHAQVGILDFGGAIQSVIVPDRHGKPVDVALGYDSALAYETQTQFVGALIGRYGNRIARSQFTLDGVDYALPANDGRNHLHGGRGFHQRFWQAQPASDGLTLTLISPAGEDGYPGTLSVNVRYLLKEQTLHIFYRATTDAATLCNLTNHAYWNLSGHAAGSVAGHQICIPADYYTLIDKEAIPTGELAAVTQTPLDLRHPTLIGAHWDSPEAQIQNVGGYDHNYVLRGAIGSMHGAGQVFSPDTGIMMSVQTTLPGVQFYSGNSLTGAPKGKDGATYSRRTGFCLETQFYPDSIHNPAWPQAILRPNEVWSHHTSYECSVQ